MRKLLLPLMAVAALSAAAAFSPRAEATVSAAPAGIRATAASSSMVEQARCWVRRVCGPRGCARRTICRRW
jgi:hypothetical protein